MARFQDFLSICIKWVCNVLICNVLYSTGQLFEQWGNYICGGVTEVTELGTKAAKIGQISCGGTFWIQNMSVREF